MTSERLPRAYRILPHDVPLEIPGFARFAATGIRTLSPDGAPTAPWFDAFADRIEAAVGRVWLPVCRMSDGEFKLALGEQPWDLRAPLRTRVKHRLVMVRNRLLQTRFVAATRPGVSSGNYSRAEWRTLRKQYPAWCRAIADAGVLALDLSYYTGWSFNQERFFPALSRWLRRAGIAVTQRNYAPFYFVYALLLGDRGERLFRGRRVLVVHGATGAKRAAIEAAILARGASEVRWHTLSSGRAAFDRLDPREHLGRVDLALVGAGVGKPAILVQLAPLAVPCIDAGYAFEVWAEPECRWNRRFCVTDREYDPARLTCVPPSS